MLRAGRALPLVIIVALTSSAARAGDAEQVVSAYSRWASTRKSSLLDVRLGWSKGLSRQFTTATGQVQIDLATGKVAVQAAGLHKGGSYDVWLVDNRPSAPGHSVRPEYGDATVKVGTLSCDNDGAASLHANLGNQAFRQFDVDVVVISEANGKLEQGVLYGAPTLFERAYAATFKNRASKPQIDASLRQLVSQGERLFRKEKFLGNGRTCATCHPSTNNFTLDPAFIARLRPDDPLFVAEFVPALAENFEKPKLMREFGLILENTNGFGNLAADFTMRGVPHTLAMPTSLAPAGFDRTTQPPLQRTGWSGDGAPGGGTLREFAIGAVTQHFTKTLNRQPGVDFRLPTDDELDALEAFQLSLGRQHDLDLAQLRLRSPIARAGLTVFQTTGKCFNCHMNAGSNTAPAGTLNANFNTGVEAFGHAATLPADDGFGTPGNGTFNTPPLVEAADTWPFFHNNSVAGLEESVAFYGSTAFNNSPSGVFLGGITLTDAEVRQIGAFLRVINALENIRSATENLQRIPRSHTAEQLLLDGLAEIDDATEVLQEGSLHPVALQHLKRAKQLLTPGPRKGRPQLGAALLLLALARADLCEPTSAVGAAGTASPGISQAAKPR